MKKSTMRTVLFNNFKRRSTMKNVFGWMFVTATSLSLTTAYANLENPEKTKKTDELTGEEVAAVDLDDNSSLETELAAD